MTHSGSFQPYLFFDSVGKKAGKTNRKNHQKKKNREKKEKKDTLPPHPKELEISTKLKNT